MEAWLPIILAAAVIAILVPLMLPPTAPPGGVSTCCWPDDYQKNSIFAIYPTTWDSTPGAKFLVESGIKNNESIVHDFVLNIIPGSATSPWFSRKNNIMTTLPSKVNFTEIAFAIPANATPGKYNFNFFACRIDKTNITSSEQCNNETYNWGEPQTLEITVKPRNGQQI